MGNVTLSVIIWKIIMNLTITDVELLLVIDKAYEAGWSGYRDLKISKINEILQEFIKSHPPKKQMEMFATSTWDNLTSPSTGSYIITT